MNFKKSTKILLIALVICAGVANVQAEPNEPVFTQDFPEYKGFNPSDSVQLDLAKFVQNTLDVRATVDKESEGKVDVTIVDVFAPSERELNFEMFGLDCKYTVESKPNYAYVMLCGQSGLNVAWIGYDKNNLNVNPEDQKIQNILMLPELNNESITKCKNVQIGQGEIDKFTIYVVCYGKSPDASSFESPDDLLYVIALSPVNGKNSIGYRGHKSVKMTDIQIGDITGEIDILLNYDKKQNEDIITVISKDDNALLPAFLAFTIKFNTLEKSWIGNGNFLSSDKPEDFVNYPITKENPGDLYDVFEDDENIYLVIQEPTPTPGLSQTPQTNFSYTVSSCGIPKTKQSANQQPKAYLECTDKVSFFQIQSAETYPVILFNSAQGGQLSNNGSGNDIIVFHNKALMGFSFNIKKDGQSKLVLESNNVFSVEDKVLNQFMRPKFAHIVDKKVYIGGILNSAGQVPKQVLSMAVYYVENNALSALHTPADSDPSDVVFVRNNLYSSEAHDYFRVRTTAGNFFAKHLNIWKAIFNVSDPDPKQIQNDVSVTFSLPNGKTQTFSFIYTNLTKGIQAITFGQGRQTTVYTDAVNQIGTYGSDFIGNNLDVKANDVTVKTDNGDAIVKVNVKYTDDIDELSIEQSNLTDVTEAFYVGDLEYAFKDSLNGIQLYSCFDFVGKSSQRNDKCFFSFDIRQNVYAPSESSKDRRYQLLEAQKNDDYYVFLLRDTDQTGMPEDGHGIVVFRSNDPKESDPIKLQKISKKFDDATMRIKDDNLEIFLALGPSQDINNGSVLSSITSLKNPDTLNFIELQDKFNSPQMCPVQVELMPDTENVFVISDCPSDDDLRARKIFQYKITKSTNPDPQGLRVDNLSTLLNVKSFDLSSFNKPQVCVTRNRIHVFETDSVSSANAQKNLIETITVDEGLMTRYYIPVSEIMTDSNITGIDSFHCNFDTSIVSATTQIEKDSKKFDTVIVIDTNKLDEPSNRIHSIRNYEVEAHADRIKGVIGGSVYSSDEVLLMFYQERSPKLKAQSIFMSGPHFFVDFSDVKVKDKDAQVLEQSVNVTVKIDKQEAVVKLNIINPITTGVPVMAASAQALELSSLTKENSKVVISSYTNFSNAPILNLNYENKHDESKITTPIIPIVSAGSEDFTFLTEAEFEFIQIDGDFALVYKNNYKNGVSSSVISVYKKGAKEVFYTNNEFIEISAAQMFKIVSKHADQLNVGLLNREDDDYLVSFITIDRESGKGEVHKTKNIENSDLQDGIIKAHFKHQTSQFQKDNIIVSMIAYTNTYVPKLIVMNFIWNDQFKDPLFWGSSFVTFQDDIIDFEVSYASDNDIESEPKGVKTGGYVGVITERSANIDIVALAFDDDEATKENEGGLRVIANYNSVGFENPQLKGESVPYKKANLTCGRTLNAIGGAIKREYNMKCAIISHSVYSPEIELILQPASTIKKNSNFAIASSNKSLINMPGFLPATVERQDDIIVVIWGRNNDGKPSTQKYLKEKYVAALYDLNQGNNFVAVYTPSDLGANPDANPLQVLIYVNYVQKDASGVSNHNIYITAPAADPSKLSGDRNMTMFRSTRLIQEPTKAVRSTKSINLAGSYIWDFSKVFENNEDVKINVSPKKDLFQYDTITESGKTVSFKEFFTNKNDPVGPDPPGPDPPGPKPKPKSKWILWVIIIVLVVALIGGAIFFLMNKKDGEDGEEEEEKENDEELDMQAKMEVDDEKTQTKSEYSRL